MLACLSRFSVIVGASAPNLPVSLWWSKGTIPTCRVGRQQGAEISMSGTIRRGQALEICRQPSAASAAAKQLLEHDQGHGLRRL